MARGDQNIARGEIRLLADLGADGIGELVAQ